MPNQNHSETSSEIQNKISEPKMYKVIMHNDDITTMLFVVNVLISVFHKGHEDACKIMLEIHNNGSAVVGVYTYDIAVTKKRVCEALAKEEGFPLRLTIDEAT